jgi:competence CoiA-like predicted nuclease
MSNHFSMGAINKTTTKYEYPKIANKINKYKCPFCEKDVIFRNGKIKQPHFAHYKSDNPCSYYEKPNETQIHKDAKLLMKTLLDNKNKILLKKKAQNK